MKSNLIRCLVEENPDLDTFLFQKDEKFNKAQRKGLHLAFAFLQNEDQEDFSDIKAQEWLEAIKWMHYLNVPEESREMDILLDLAAFSIPSQEHQVLQDIQKYVTAKFWKSAFRHRITDSKPYMRCEHCDALKKPGYCPCRPLPW